jgi:hypothetical protein
MSRSKFTSDLDHFEMNARHGLDADSVYEFINKRYKQ